MLDSINLIQNNCKINEYTLNNLGIAYKEYFDRPKRYKPNIIAYDFKGKKHYCSNFGYYFEYKNMMFKYSKLYKYLMIITKPNKLLNKRDVCLSDKPIYKQIVKNAVNDILPFQKLSINISRIDFKCDLTINDKVMLELYIDLFNKHDVKYRYMKKIKKYKTSLYLSNKNGQFTFNFYDKEQERFSKNDMEGAEYYKNILRLEIQVKPAKLKSEARKDKPIEPILDNYFCKEGMEKYYFDILSPYLYEGATYYRKRIAKGIINNNTMLRDVWKKKLKDFLEAVNKYGGVRNTYEHRYCYRQTAKEYVKRLTELGINPITLADNCPYDSLENLVKLAREKAIRDYFK